MIKYFQEPQEEKSCVGSSGFTEVNQWSTNFSSEHVSNTFLKEMYVFET